MGSSAQIDEQGKGQQAPPPTSGITTTERSIRKDHEMDPRTIIGTTRGRLGIVAAGVVMMTAAFAPAAALAAPAPASVQVTETATGGLTVTGVLSNGSTCTSQGEWKGVGPGTDGGGSSTVEWLSNSQCGFSIQERSWCAVTASTGSWAQSGVVVKNFLADGSECTSPASITRGEVRAKDVGGWSTYQTFWTP
jgi:hypothetical protein